MSNVHRKNSFAFNSTLENEVLMPDVRGFTARSAAAIIHELGLRVQWSGTGKISGTHPTPGSAVSIGDTVSLVSQRSDGDG